MLNFVGTGARRVHRLFFKGRHAEQPPPAAQLRRAQERMRSAKRLVDLGCGANPHPRAVVGVDAYRDPDHRILGHGPKLDAATFRNRGVQFVQADLAALPFVDKEFDFAYSHHVFEHLPDPKRACAEMCRIATAGVVYTPSIFSEIAFGRPYHLWLVIARGNSLIFVRKTAEEDRPFGQHPESDGKASFRATDDTNPFEILLNDEGWYRGREKMARLSRLLRRHWYSHSPVTEVILPWENSFQCIVIHEDGHVE